MNIHIPFAPSRHIIHFDSRELKSMEEWLVGIPLYCTVYGSEWQ